MANLKYGSSGDEVKKLQEALGFTGADVDGQFGPKTQQAVKDYQQKNGLSVDGIVGNETWGSLTKPNSGASSSASTSAPSATPTTTPNEGSTPTITYEPNKKTDAVAQAEALLKEHLAQKPGAYNSTWQAQLDETLNKILNREDFSYDLNGDALYQQYKDQFKTQGQLAMMDTMGQAAALTGGYGNSYAQGVGQQAYQGYIQQLNDRVPELYQLALSQYNQKGQDLRDQYGMFADREQQDYGRYRDQLGDYYTELDRLADDARYQSEQDYAKWADKLNLGYGMYRDQVADKQWQAQFDEAKRQYDEQYALKNGGKSGGSPGGSVGGNYDEDAAKKQLQLVSAGYNVAVDGIWGPESKAAWEKYQNEFIHGGVSVLSSAAKNFMSNLPYAHAGSDPQTWKNVVDERLENSDLSDDDKVAIMKELGLF